MKDVPVYKNDQLVGTAKLYTARNEHDVESWHADILLDDGREMKGEEISEYPLIVLRLELTDSDGIHVVTED